jgi:anti-anti-sigma factor
LLDLVMALDPTSDTTVELDMSEVTFVDSQGLGAILRARSYLDARRCTLKVTRPQRQFLRLIELTGLAEVLPLEITTDDAGDARGDQ